MIVENYKEFGVQVADLNDGSGGAYLEHKGEINKEAFYGAIKVSWFYDDENFKSYKLIGDFIKF